MKRKAPEEHKKRERQKKATTLHVCFPAAERIIFPPLKVPSPCECGEEAGFLYAIARKGLSLGMCIVCVSVLSAEAAVSPIVPG